ncbi:metallophosphoesterase [Psychrobacter sp. NG27]|uniref:metallophosphoesterase n=1 Tax=Psychrobacter sp. NG27 TaxID=2781966 RepID=UPI0018DEF2C4|nr:metallophosphoesterase [Psychrobacter sp. NG27]MBI0427046.1 metallophosphoesterase [Psychrobacter sp. NG27]
MQSYPTNQISTPDAQLNILQITDLHLSTPVITDSHESNASTFCQHSFENVLRQALNEDIRCDLIIVTGDLVNRVDTHIYDHIFEVLQSTQIPFACIAGNHDVTDENGMDLPFFQRELVARTADRRLLNRHAIESEHWQLLFIDSSITGKVEGEIRSIDIEWLRQRLTACSKPALIALHHHIISIDSAWIDTHMAQNTESFWQNMVPFEHLQVIISGHTHQEQVRYRQGVTVYSTPSTCYQFKPNVNEFAYDESGLPGYRWLQLANNGEVASWVERLDT